MDNQTFQRIKDLITQHQAIGVVVRPNASLDEMAAGLGMYLVLAGMGKAAAIASPTGPVVGLSGLVGIQKVKKSLGVSSATNDQLTVSFPYKNQDDIEKVWYTQENGFLNVMVKGGPRGLTFGPNDVKFSEAGGAEGAGAMPTLLFAIGVSNLSDIASVVSQDALQTMTVVNIDNKQENTKYGDVVVVSPRFSSVSEQVADFLTLLEPQIELDRDASQNLFDGISFATKDYTAQNTSYLAFEMAGILMKKGATRYKAPGASVQPGQNVSQYFPPIPNNPLQPFGQAQGQQTPVQQPAQSMAQPIMQQPVQQPMPQFTPAPQPFGNVQAQQPAAPLQQPIQPMAQQPFGQAQGQQPQFTQAPQQPFEQPAQAQQQQPVETPNSQAPADWLTPKVYKGSSII